MGSPWAGSGARVAAVTGCRARGASDCASAAVSHATTSLGTAAAAAALLAVAALFAVAAPFARKGTRPAIRKLRRRTKMAEGETRITMHRVDCVLSVLSVCTHTDIECTCMRTCMYIFAGCVLRGNHGTTNYRAVVEVHTVSKPNFVKLQRAPNQ